MPTPFQAQIRLALANPDLQAALDANAERRQNAFRQAYASLPEDLQVMRQRAHAVRAETITNLDHYLKTFINNAEANGTQIHHASDASQAIDIVRQIVRETQASLVVKSKTMVGEEIHINQALEADGIKVVESDLGEYIVQLREEPPAHIITPAVHLSRSQVGQTFHEKLDLPLTDDVPTLTAAARRVLRQTFLDADIGISGVNFGIAESGDLCLLTNEGNGRMVATLPDVHIALMGIERLVPTYDDLALMLYLLPRSATGQKLTVYASLIRGPRRSDEIDGPHQRHLVLIDNGRQDMQASPLREMLYCIRCGACLNACPVFREIGGHAYVSRTGKNTPYPGPMGSVVSPGLFGVPEYGHLARASSLCGACKQVCPVDIDLPTLLSRVRAAGAQSPSAPDAQRSGSPIASLVPGGLRIGLHIFTWIAKSARLYAAAQQLAGLISPLLAPRSSWIRLPAFTGWGFSRDFPRPASPPFRARYKNYSQTFNPSFKFPNPSTPSPTGSSTAQPPSAPAPLPPSTNLLARFQEELEALNGVFIQCDQNQLAQSLLKLLQSREIDAIQAWDESHLPESLLENLRGNGIQIFQEPDARIRAGLTSAIAAVAETGTLVLPAGPGRPLTASLLPEVHIAILNASDIKTTMAEALNLPELKGASSVNFISGPSRTADIEMTLTIGVHGPGELFVFCLAAPD